MRILALDLGTKTGWAITPEESGVWNFSPSRFEGGGFRYLRFRKQLQTIFDSGIDAVFFEEVRNHSNPSGGFNVDAAHVYGGLLAVLSSECEERGIPYRSLTVQEIKKSATGKGNSPKLAMIEAARKKWPLIKIIDDNHADALWIMETAKNRMPNS